MNLAREIDNRINGLRSKFGGISDTGLMVMMAITLADELAEAGQRIKQLEEVAAGRNRTAQTGHRRFAQQRRPSGSKMAEPNARK
jgi:cell division protein ZapA (FtsZ GTPase activity inhibitor)